VREIRGASRRPDARRRAAAHDVRERSVGVKKHWVGILISLGAIALIVWMAMHMSFKEVTVPTALKGEAMRNPFYAAIKFSEALGAQAAWERVFTVPAKDSVIVLSSWNWTLSRTRRERIERWVESGGRLVVDASLIGDLDGFERWSGIGEVKASGASADEDQDEERQVEEAGEDTPIVLEPFFAPDCSILTEDGTGRVIKVCGIDRTHSLTSARKMQWALLIDGRIEALRTKVGRGSVTVLNATPFRRRDFFLGDHPTLFVKVTQLHRGDSLWLFTEEDHASLLTLVWRFGAPVVLLLFAAIALALWRATARFGPPTAPAETARRSLAEQIRGTGQFALRFGGGQSLHAAEVRALRDAAIRRLPAFDRMSSEERIAALARLSSIAGEELGPALNYSGTRSSHELRNAIAIIETARRRILMQGNSSKGKGSKHGN
jgi:hypothetical protein